MGRIQIHLEEFRTGSTYLGREHGESVRKEVFLDRIDNFSVEVAIIIPEGTTAFNPSFFLGLFGKSIQTLGIKKFEKKYKFIFIERDQRVVNILSESLEDGKRYSQEMLNPSWFQKIKNLFR